MAVEISKENLSTNETDRAACLVEQAMMIKNEVLIEQLELPLEDAIAVAAFLYQNLVSCALAERAEVGATLRALVGAPTSRWTA